MAGSSPRPSPAESAFSGRRSTSARGRSVALLLGAFLALAVLKPWEPPAASRSSDAPAPAAASTQASAPAASTHPSGPTASIAHADASETSPDAIASPGAAGDPIATRTGWDAVSGIVRAIGLHGGTWGAGTGWWSSVDGGWTDWRPRHAAPAPVDPPALGSPSAACRGRPLRGGGRLIAVTGPAGLVDDVGVSLWRLGNPPLPMDLPFSVARPSDTPGTLFLVLPQAESWPDDAYELVLRSSARSPIALQACVGDPTRPRLPVH